MASEFEVGAQFNACRCGEGYKQLGSCQNCKVLNSGPLLISSKGIGWTSWKKRWFILTRTSLVYYRSDPSIPPVRGSESNVALGGIDLNNSGSVVLKEDRKLLILLLSDDRQSRTYTLKAETSEELNDWKEALENALVQAPKASSRNSHNKLSASVSTEVDRTSYDQAAGSGVVGRPVQFALEDGDGSPSILEKALRFIEEYGTLVEGIFRQSADVDDVRHRIREYEEGNDNFSSKEDAHVVGDCIKYILREIPSSPVPASCCTALVEAFRCERENRVNAMHKVIISETFPEPNKRLLQRVLKMMQTVSLHQSVNRMSIPALAACMAPILLRPLLAGDCQLGAEFSIRGDASMQLLQAAAAANHAQAIVIILLEEYERIFPEDSSEEHSHSEGYTESEDEYVENEDFIDNEFQEDIGSNNDVSGDHEGSCETCSESGSVQGSPQSREKGAENNCLDASDGKRAENKLEKRYGNLLDLIQESCEPVGKVSSLNQLINPTIPAPPQRHSISSEDQSEKLSNALSAKLDSNSARTNNKVEDTDYSSDNETVIYELERKKRDLQAKIANEMKENANLQGSLERCWEALEERHIALQNDVEILRAELQKERNSRASLERGISKKEQLSTLDQKDFNDIHGQLNSKIWSRNASECESCSQQGFSKNQLIKQDCHHGSDRAVAQQKETSNYEMNIRNEALNSLYIAKDQQHQKNSTSRRQHGKATFLRRSSAESTTEEASSGKSAVPSESNRRRSFSSSLKKPLQKPPAGGTGTSAIMASPEERSSTDQALFVIVRNSSKSERFSHRIRF